MVLVVTFWGKKMIEAPKKIDGVGKGVVVFCFLFLFVCIQPFPLLMSVTHIVEAWMRTCQKKLFFPEKMFDDFILQCSCVSR